MGMSNFLFGFAISSFFAACTFGVQYYLQETNEMNGADISLFMAIGFGIAAIIAAIIGGRLHRRDIKIRQKKEYDQTESLNEIMKSLKNLHNRTIPTNKDQLIRAILKVRNAAMVIIDSNGTPENTIAFNTANTELENEGNVAGAQHGIYKELIDNLIIFISVRTFVSLFPNNRNTKASDDSKQRIDDVVNKAVKLISATSPMENNNAKTGNQ